MNCKIGDERLRQLTSTPELKEWYILTNKGWRRKAVFILENVLNRKLHGHEYQIVFIDGNRLNCTLKNLLVSTFNHLMTCPDCGFTRLDKHSGRSGYCRRCNNKRTGIKRRGRRHPKRTYQLGREVTHNRNGKWDIYVKIQHHTEQRNSKVCGTPSHIKRKRTKLCNTCYRLFVEPQKRAGQKLTIIQVSCIRGLLGKNLTCVKIAAWFRIGYASVINIKCGKTWKEIKPMAKKEVWKALLEQHDKLKKTSGVTLYDRVTLLAKVYEDPHFATAMKKGGKSPTEELDYRVNDTCANFTELLQILRLFPQKKKWSSGNLNEMRLKMLEKLREGQNGKRKKTKKKDNGRSDRRTATLSQLRTLEAKNEEIKQDLGSEIKRLKSELQSANRIIKSLETQLESMGGQLEASRETIGSLNETISMIKLAKEDKGKLAKELAK